MDNRTVEEKIVDCFRDQRKRKYSTSEIKGIVTRKHPEVAAGSVIPTDYCYNLINAGILRYLGNEVTFNGSPFGHESFRYRLFEQIERGWFRYLGTRYKYTGSITWNEKFGQSREVGEWEQGEFRLREEPKGRKDKGTES